MFGGTSNSYSRGPFQLPLSRRAGADLRVEQPPRARPATSFRDDVRGFPQSPPSARPGAGPNEPIVSAGAAPSASAMPRSMVGEGGGRFPSLTPGRLHQIASQLGGDRAPAIRHSFPSRRSVGVLPSVDPVASREHCGGDCRFDPCGHYQPLSTGNICGGASQVIWQVSEDFQ